ncbi:MAG: nuclear transport factor 2 family protein [Flavobacteriales bacterium]|nr:nuclear transport factor 2 family protein [Flavobacteriales bacterium]
MSEKEIIECFYTSFASRDSMKMVALYHDEVLFEDPAFGKLYGERAKAMWRMLVARLDHGAKILHGEIVQLEDGRYRTSWEAHYKFGPKKRDVVNKITATLGFKDGKIISHKDEFSFWKWSRQAMGPLGWLLGWTPGIKKKLQAHTNNLLDKWVETELN